MDNTEEVTKQIAKLGNQIARTLAKTEAQHKRVVATVRTLQVRCAQCETFSPLPAWTFIQDRYLVPTRGYTGGGYYNDSSIETCHLQCPQCNYRNYLYQRTALTTLIKQSRVPLKDLFDTNILVDENSGGF